MIKINWKLDKSFKDSIYDNIIINEYTNYNKVKGFIYKNNGISFSSNKKYSFVNKIYKNEIQQMKAYINLYDKNKNIFQVNTCLCDYKWGRIKYNKHASLSIFHRPTRHTFCQGIYIDIDIVNSAPTIIKEVCRINNYNCNNLKKYVENRDKIFDEIRLYYDVSKETVKKLFIIILSGGSYITWLKDNEIDVMNKEKLEIINNLENEMELIREIVYSNNIDMLNQIKKVKPNKWNTISEEKKGISALWYQTIERNIQETIIKFLIRDKKFDIKDIIPCQDGFMILEKYYYENILNDCMKEIKDIYDIDLLLKIKEFDEKFELDEYTGNIFENFDFLITTTDFLKYLYECNEYKNKIFKIDEKNYYKFNDKLKIFEIVKSQYIRQEISEYILTMLRENKFLLDEKVFLKYETKYGNEMTKILKDYIITKDCYKLFNRLKYFIPIKNNKIMYIGEKKCKIYMNEVIFPKNNIYDDISSKIYEKNEIIDRTDEHYFSYYSNIDYIENLSDEQEFFCTKYFEDLFCGNKDTINSVLNILKTSISGVVLKYLFCCVGEKGNNGKSVFFDNVLKEIMCDSMDVLNKSVLIESNIKSGLNTECEKLDKIRLGYVSEFKETDIFNDTLIKSITGKDKIALRTLHEKESTIHPTCNLFINTNQLPKNTMSCEKDPALFNRILIIPFKNKFEKNSLFLTDIKNNIDALFSYIIQKGIIQEDNIDISDEMKFENNKYIENNKKESFLADFLDEKIIYIENFKIERNDLYDKYYEWCYNKNINEKKMSYGLFTKILNKDFNIKNNRSNSNVYLENIKYK